MKLRRIFAAVAACAIAATSVISASAYTADVTGDLGMKDAVTLGTEEAQGNWALNLAAPGVLDGVKAEDIYGASVTFTKASIDNYIAEAAGVGGGFVWNTTDGWAQKEWGNADAKKEITLDDENRTITRLDEEPCFTADSVSGAEGTWGQVVVVLWWGPKAGMEIESVSLLARTEAFSRLLVLLLLLLRLRLRRTILLLQKLLRTTATSRQAQLLVSHLQVLQSQALL